MMEMGNGILKGKQKYNENLSLCVDERSKREREEPEGPPPQRGITMIGPGYFNKGLDRGL
jgi:hypothetical protein